MSNTITIKLNEDDRQVLDGILVMLCEINSRLGGQAEPVAAQTEAVEETIAPAAKAPTEADTAPQEAEEKPAVTHEDIRSAYMRLSTSGKKEAAQKAIKALDVVKISDIPADKLADALASLTALEG